MLISTSMQYGMSAGLFESDIPNRSIYVPVGTDTSKFHIMGQV